ELPMSYPITNRSFIQACDSGNILFRLMLRNSASLSSNDNGNFTLVVQLRRLGWPHQVHAVPDKRAWKTRKHAGVAGRRGSILVFLVTQAIVDAHTDNLFRARHRNAH